MTPSRESRPLPFGRDVALLLTLFLVVAAIRITAPSDIATGDQPLQAENVRTIVERGDWIVQYHADGTAASKPPLYNWLAAIPILLAGGENEFLLKLPSLLAGLGTLLLTWSMTQSLAGRRAALVAGVLLVCSTMVSKQMYFARTDMLLTFFVAAQIWAALESRALLCWTAAALAVLTKGPVGLLIPVATLTTWWWWEGSLRERARAIHLLPGIAASLVPFAAWFAAALYVDFPAVWEEMVVRETIDRFGSGSKTMEHRHVAYYIPQFLARMAPASLLAVAALASMRWRRGESAPPNLPAWWLIAPFVLLSIIPSKRFDRLFPLFPAVCILAGWAVDRWLARERTRGVGPTLGAIALVAIAGGAALASGLFAHPLRLDASSIPAATAAGLLLAAAGIALLIAVMRRNSPGVIGAIAATMLIVIGFYQHRFSEPARGLDRPDAVREDGRLPPPPRP